jgi:hypothetical protein
VVCCEHGIGGDGEYRGDNDAQFDRINVPYHEVSGGIYAPRAVLFDFEPGVIGAVRARRRSASSSARTTSKIKTRAREATGLRATTQELGTNSAESPCSVAAL